MTKPLIVLQDNNSHDANGKTIALCFSYRFLLIIEIHKLIVHCNFRLGLATKQQCESVLKQTKYDVEMAASLLLDQAR